MVSAEPHLTMPVRLRGHHFLCVLTYRGKGYTERFVARMTQVVEAIKAGRKVVLLQGPDDICAGLTEKCRADAQHDCYAADIRRLDGLAVDAVTRVLKRDLNQPHRLSKADIQELRSAYAAGVLRAACEGCSWHGFCDQIVAERFAGTKLHPPV